MNAAALSNKHAKYQTCLTGTGTPQIYDNFINCLVMGSIVKGQNTYIKQYYHL